MMRVLGVWAAAMQRCLAARTCGTKDGMRFIITACMVGLRNIKLSTTHTHMERETAPCALFPIL